MPATNGGSKRYFDTGDHVTDHNLARLDHFASQAWYGDASTMHDWICGIIDSQKLLPPAVSKHFSKGSYYTGSQHFETDDAGRKRLWERLAAQLKSEVDAVLADPGLKREAAPDLSGRPQSLGERLVKICDQLLQAISKGGDVDGLATRLEHEASGTEVAYNARQIRKLLGRKRIPDMKQHPHDLYRLAYHAKIVAGRLLHRD